MRIVLAIILAAMLFGAGISLGFLKGSVKTESEFLAAQAILQEQIDDYKKKLKEEEIKYIREVQKHENDIVRIKNDFDITLRDIDNDHRKRLHNAEERSAEYRRIIESLSKDGSGRCEPIIGIAEGLDRSLVEGGRVARELGAAAKAVSDHLTKLRELREVDLGLVNKTEK